MEFEFSAKKAHEVWRPWHYPVCRQRHLSSPFTCGLLLKHQATNIITGDHFTQPTSRPEASEDIRSSILEEVTSDNNEPHTKVSKEPFEIRDDDDGGTRENEFDCSLKESAIKSSPEALQMTKQLPEFAEYRGLGELSSAVLNVNDILRDLRLREPRKQTLIDSFFKVYMKRKLSLL